MLCYSSRKLRLILFPLRYHFCQICIVEYTSCDFLWTNWALQTGWSLLHSYFIHIQNIFSLTKHWFSDYFTIKWLLLATPTFLALNSKSGGRVVIPPEFSKGKPCSFTLSFLKEIDSVKESYFLTGLVERKVNKREIWCIDISRGLVIFPLLYILSLKNVDISLAIIISDFSVSKFQ